ncbi:Hypothetical protein D9617_15g042740 [Elsinoe fawcettii]|nr:Hypothetical protein D9617_15g042740 [Elsinoe fawcettii]
MSVASASVLDQAHPDSLRRRALTSPSTKPGVSTTPLSMSSQLANQPPTFSSTSNPTVAQPTALRPISPSQPKPITQDACTQTTGQGLSIPRPDAPYAPLKNFKIIRNLKYQPAGSINSYFVYFVLLGQTSGAPLILPCPAVIPVIDTEAYREIAGSCKVVAFTINLGDGTVMVKYSQNNGQQNAITGIIPKSSLSFSDDMISIPDLPFQKSTGAPGLTPASNAPLTPS